MAIAFLLEWPGVTPEQYDAVIRDLDLHDKVSPGQLYHAAGPVENGWRIVDVWESPERFQAFLTSRLLPTLERHDIGAPQASPWPVYHTLTP
jgi:hypothetical protein